MTERAALLIVSFFQKDGDMGWTTPRCCFGTSSDDDLALLPQAVNTFFLLGQVAAKQLMEDCTWLLIVVFGEVIDIKALLLLNYSNLSLNVLLQLSRLS